MDSEGKTDANNKNDSEQRDFEDKLKQKEDDMPPADAEDAPQDGDIGQNNKMNNGQEERDPYKDEMGRQLTDEEAKTVGTDKQTAIIKDYPSQNLEDKIKVPYFMKQNGNICIKQAQKQQ